MSSQETRDRADVDSAQVATAADAATPAVANQTGTESNDDWEAELDADLNEWFCERDAADQKATDSADADVEKKEEKKELAALLEKSARSAPPPSSTTFAPFLFGILAKYPPAPAKSFAPATPDPAGFASCLEDEKKGMSKDIEQLKKELEEQKRLREEAEQNCSVTDLELGTMNGLLYDKTKEAASFGEEMKRLRAEKQAWAQERQNLTGQAETLGATVSALRAERATNQSLNDLANRMRGLRIRASRGRENRRAREPARSLEQEDGGSTIRRLRGRKPRHSGTGRVEAPGSHGRVGQGGRQEQFSRREGREGPRRIRCWISTAATRGCCAL